MPRTSCAQVSYFVPKSPIFREVLCLMRHLVPGRFCAWGDFVPSKKHKKCVSNFVPRPGDSVPRPGHSVPGHSVPRRFCAHTIDYVVQKSEFLNF